MKDLIQLIREHLEEGKQIGSLSAAFNRTPGKNKQVKKDTSKNARFKIKAALKKYQFGGDEPNVSKRRTRGYAD